MVSNSTCSQYLFDDVDSPARSSHLAWNMASQVRLSYLWCSSNPGHSWVEISSKAARSKAKVFFDSAHAARLCIDVGIYHVGLQCVLPCAEDSGSRRICQAYLSYWEDKKKLCLMICNRLESIEARSTATDEDSFNVVSFFSFLWLSLFLMMHIDEI